MDSRVQVALIEKAKRIFTLSSDTFLSFPLLSPVTFQPEVLAAIQSPQSPTDYVQAADFARVMNFIPKDIVAVPDSPAVLWEIYDNVLSRGQPALARNDPAAEARQQAAQALLYQTNADGTRQESPVYSDYRRFRDAWIVAQENYGAQRLTGEFATDEAVKKQWVEVTEPKLRALVDQALADWETLGHRAEVDGALADQRLAAESAPSTRWNEWRSDFNTDTDLLHTGAQSFAPTGFSPSDVSTSSSWLHTTLETDEIAALVAGAPPELHPEGNSEIERLEFDFRSVAITRPWFDSDALTSRIWRLPTEDEPLSDGNDPPSGRLPAYVAAIVLVRNVVATMKATDSGQRTLPLLFTIPAQALTKRQLQIDPAATFRIRAATEISTSATETAPGANKAFLKLRRSSFSASELRPVGPALQVARPARFATVVEESPAVGAGRFARLRSLVGATRLGAAVETAALPDPPPQPQPPPEPDKSISVLAFICKRLPKTPDPLPELLWS